MGLIEKLNNFFIVVLPEKIDLFSNFLIYELGGYAWGIFIITILVIGFLLVTISKKYLQFTNKQNKQSEFLDELRFLGKTTDIENKIFNFSSRTLQCKYSALYELRGATYILLSSNVSSSKDNSGAGISMRIPNSKVHSLKYSGNYKIFQYLSFDKKYLLLLHSSKNFDISFFESTLKIALSFYQVIIEKEIFSTDKQLAKVNEETMHAIVQAQFGKEGYLKFLISIILKIFNAKGGRIVSQDGSEDYIVGNIDISMQKEFFIRNTPYKFKYYNDNEIELKQIKEIGAFLDLSGSFLVSLDQQSSIMQNYIKFLKNANAIMEETTPYYKGHSSKIKIVAVEVAKNLFVDQDTLNNIELASELHDIGMIGNMEVILNHDNKLDQKEIDLMHYHPVIGSILLEPITHLYPIANIVKQHHERYDGNGYPNQISGSAISLDSQTVSLAEHFIGLISDRSYKKGMDFDQAVEEIKKVSRKMFDSVVVEAFIESKTKIKNKLIKLENKTT